MDANPSAMGAEEWMDFDDFVPGSVAPEDGGLVGPSPGSSNIAGSQKHHVEILDFGDDSDIDMDDIPKEGSPSADVREKKPNKLKIGKKGMDTTECYSGDTLKLAYLISECLFFSV